jgi:nitrogen fixation protein NifB
VNEQEAHMNHENHPCFSEGAKHRFGRIHLPVAPKCNMQCNYCNRDFECVNESRPGVSSTILTPRQAADYLDTVLQKMQDIAVVGIAGPGDPFANASETLETLHLVRERHPEMMLCLATNGLELSRHVADLARLKISHVTVTVNAVDPEVGRSIYAWARVDRKMYRGVDAARIILEKQLEGIRELKKNGMVVKINTVIIPGINDGHVEEIAKCVSGMKADIFNCIPLYHVAGTPFASISSPSQDQMESIRERVKTYLPQMSHCSRCRADAAGLIGQPQNNEVLELLKEASRLKVTSEKPYVAVASMEGIFVNQHLGEATSLWIFGIRDGKTELLERRFAPSPGGGAERWNEMADLLDDCSAVLVSSVGQYPQIALERAGIRVVVMEGLASEGVEALLSGREIPKILLRAPGRCGMGKECTGTGMGCG